MRRGGNCRDQPADCEAHKSRGRMKMKYSDLDPRLAAAVKTAKEPNTPAPVIPFVRQRVRAGG